ncbi:hypothetical protein GPJ56_010137 [Histomonas meleagridis]|uniref:uncharacterized protein n=1 Tax=Histomonas meleagridis TaxID=135588 RepID=UPI00355A05EF|nr:hypothetical protein GPJ56_010137 [Histomonas meleagridis]KAH0806794.1 hypothetical protein GO595_000437 [Histomonas meleagridis]
MANEKERSVGILCEQLAEMCETASKNQFSTVQTTLVGFATILYRIELSRKSLYQRINILSENFLLNSSKNVQATIQELAKRDSAFKKIQKIPPAENDPHAAKNNALLTQASQTNIQVCNSVQAWSNQYNTELKNDLREYAVAQMEFAAKALEQWTNFLSDLAILDFNTDTDEAISMLEEDVEN